MQFLLHWVSSTAPLYAAMPDVHKCALVWQKQTQRYTVQDPEEETNKQAAQGTTRQICATLE
jgi:hypothetical protein